MKKRIVLHLLIVAILAALMAVPVRAARVPIAYDAPEGTYLDASAYGLSPANKAVVNSTILQGLIDAASQQGGGVILIPEGEYRFARTGTQTIGTHCIKLRSNVTLRGMGEKTVLMPVGASKQGLDMFYFNEYLDTGKAVYLENCRFEDFVIDAAETSCRVYTSAGKGFMFNLFRNCHWRRVTVKNTDATGFGVDCPIGSSIRDCLAIGCGKAANTANAGASGFGIGFGFSDEESMVISNCVSIGNKKFGFFFEHQGRFNAVKYAAWDAEGFVVRDCETEGNLYNFGGIRAMKLRYEHCRSAAPRGQGFYFEDSAHCAMIECEEK